MSVELAPGVELVKSTVPPLDPPGAMFPSACGSGVPLVAPNFAIVSEAPFAGNEPWLVTVYVALTLVGPVRANVEVTTSLTMPHPDCEPTIKVYATVPRLIAPSCS